MICKSNIIRKSAFTAALAIFVITGCQTSPDQPRANANLANNVQAAVQRDKNREHAAKLVGTWAIESATLQKSTGEKEQFYGDKPQGSLSFDQNGRYMLTVIRSELRNYPFNSKNRETGTPEENRRVVQWSIANFGNYDVVEPHENEDKNKPVLVLNIEAATYPNWTGITQRRSFEINAAGDELTYVVPEASSGPGTTATFVWRRIK